VVLSVRSIVNAPEPALAGDPSWKILPALKTTICCLKVLIVLSSFATAQTETIINKEDADRIFNMTLPEWEAYVQAMVFPLSVKARFYRHDRMLRGVKKRASNEAGNFAGSLSFKSYGTYGNCGEESYLPCLASDLFLRPVAWERINEHLHLLAGGEKEDMVIGIRFAYQSKQPPKSFIEQNNYKIPKIVDIGLKTSLALNVQKVIVNPGFMDDEYCGP